MRKIHKRKREKLNAQTSKYKILIANNLGVHHSSLILHRSLLIICCFFLYQTTIQAQLSKGNIIVDAFGDYSLTSSRGDGEFVTITQMGASYFINDNFAVGGRLSLFTFENEASFSLGSNIRYYLSTDKKSNWFIENNLNLNDIGDFQTFSGDFGVGVDYFINPHFAIETKVAAGWERRNGFSGNRGLFNLGTGLKFFLNRNTEEEITNGILRRGTIIAGISSSNLQLFTNSNDGVGGTGGNILLLSLTPSIAKMLTDQFAIGGQIEMVFQNNSVSEASFLSLDVTPYARFYPNPTRKESRIFFEFGGGLNFVKFDNGVFGNEFSESSGVFFGGIGLDLFLAPSVALEFKGSYRRSKQFGQVNLNRLGLDVGFQFFIGEEVE